MKDPASLLPAHQESVSGSQKDRKWLGIARGAADEKDAGGADTACGGG